MSDRMNLWPDKVDWADVNLCEHKNLPAAIRAFGNWAQTLKVYGPERTLKECYRHWRRLERDRSVPPAASVSWFISLRPIPGKSQPVKEWIPEGEA